MENKKVTNAVEAGGQLNLYISDIKRTDGNGTFKVFKTRKGEGKNTQWANVKFTEEAGKPKAVFTINKKGYVCIIATELNTVVVGVSEKTGKEIIDIWVKAWKIADDKTQKAFEKHLLEVQEQYREEDKKRAQSFFHNK